MRRATAEIDKARWIYVHYRSSKKTFFWWERVKQMRINRNTTKNLMLKFDRSHASMMATVTIIIISVITKIKIAIVIIAITKNDNSSNNNYNNNNNNNNKNDVGIFEEEVKDEEDSIGQ